MIIAVDTGGTKTLITGFERDGTMTKLAKFPTPDDESVYVEQLLTTILPLKTQIDAIVIAFPGTVVNGVLLRGGNISWHNFDIRKELRSSLPTTPTFVENDANLAGLGEARALNPMPRRVLYVTISTGFGGGFIVDGAIEPSLATAEFGAMRLMYDGRLQKFEHFASGHAIAEHYHQFAHDITSESDWSDITDRFVTGFAAFIPIVRPDIIIIGGSVGTYFERFGPLLQAKLQAVLPEHYHCPIVQAKHPEEAVVYGCYYYAIDQLGAA